MNRSARSAQKVLCLFLAICMGISPSIAMAASIPSGKTAKDAFPYIVPDAVVAGVVYPRRVLTAPHMELMPVELITAAGLQEWGFDPMDVESVTFMVLPPMDTKLPPGFGVVILFQKSYSLDDLKPGLTQDAEKTSLNVGPCLKGRMPMDPSFFMPDDKTLLIGPMPVLQGMLNNDKATKKESVLPLVKMISGTSDVAVAAEVKTVAPLLTMLMQSKKFPPLPPEVKKEVEKLPALIESARLKGKLIGNEKWSLDLTCKNENDAAELNKIVGNLLDMWQKAAIADLDRYPPAADSPRYPIHQATKKYATRVTDKIFNGLRPTQKGKVVHWSIDFSKDQGIMNAGLFMGMLIPMWTFRAVEMNHARATMKMDLQEEFHEVPEKVEEFETAPPFPEQPNR